MSGVGITRSKSTAWRFCIEGREKGRGIDQALVFELLEIEVSNPVSKNKLDY